MAHAQIRQHIGIGNKRIRDQEAERRGLDRPAEKQGAGFERLGQISHYYFTDVAATAAIENQAKSPFGIMLADEHHSALEKGATQLAAVEEQLAFQKFVRLRHTLRNCRIVRPEAISIYFRCCQRAKR